MALTPVVRAERLEPGRMRGRRLRIDATGFKGAEGPLYGLLRGPCAGVFIEL